jgi:peptidoglycan/xylan/chitin deacetylase (PgdA/CDA1 family)
MAAKFILSFDCEGKWGVADLLNPDLHRNLTDDRITAAYDAIVSMLDDFKIPATFAFVGAFAQPEAEFGVLEDGLRTLCEFAPYYLGPALFDMKEGSKQGWHGDRPLEKVASAATGHEIALHGFTHVPWSNWKRKSIELEMMLWRSMGGPVRHSRTFVYPRNDVAHIELLAEAGFEAFRGARPSSSRLHSLISEFNVRTPPDRDPRVPGSIVEIPAGHFVNWDHGLRRIVPRFVSLRRAYHMLSTASRDGGVVHYWLHPENLATAPSTIILLKQLLRLVSELRDKGRCEVLTQLNYSRDLMK